MVTRTVEVAAGVADEAVITPANSGFDNIFVDAGNSLVADDARPVINPLSIRHICVENNCWGEVILNAGYTCQSWIIENDDVSTANAEVLMVRDSAGLLIADFKCRPDQAWLLAGDTDSLTPTNVNPIDSPYRVEFDTNMSGVAKKGWSTVNDEMTDGELLNNQAEARIFLNLGSTIPDHVLKVPVKLGTSTPYSHGAGNQTSTGNTNPVFFHKGVLQDTGPVGPLTLQTSVGYIWRSGGLVPIYAHTLGELGL